MKKGNQQNHWENMHTHGELLNKIKEQKGSITLFVLVACMFMITVLLLVNIGIMNKNASQEKELAQIAKRYSVNETDLADTYAKIIDENGYPNYREVQEMIKNAIDQAKKETYPVGSIYISTNSTNPSEYIGGTWESYGQGRTLVGEGTGTDSNNEQQLFTAEATGGEYNHTLTIAEMPNHSHGFLRNYVGSGYNYPERTLASKSETAGGSPMAVTTYATGGDGTHNNIQPYIVTYMWKRTK